MSAEPTRNILTILFDEITGEIFYILNSNKNEKMEREEIRKRLEKSNFDCSNLNNILDSLKARNLLIVESKEVKIEEEKNKNQNNPNKKYKNRTRKVIYYYYKLNYTNLELLKDKYEKTRDSIEKNLKDESKKKWICPKCHESYDANDAYRENLKCKKQNCKQCNLEEKEGKDVTDITKKCNDIFEILDEFFNEYENQATGTTSGIYEYLKSKYGKDYRLDRKDKVTIIEENDPYVQYTIDKIQSQRNQGNKKDDILMNFCKLVEYFSSNNQKTKKSQKLNINSSTNNCNSA